MEFKYEGPTFSREEVREKAAELLLRAWKEDGESATFERAWSSAINFGFHDACLELGLPIAGEWAISKGATIPPEVADQLLGRRFEMGMTVEYSGFSCAVVCLDLNSDMAGTSAANSDFGVEDIFRISALRVGEIIPFNARIEKLVLVPSCCFRQDV